MQTLIFATQNKNKVLEISKKLKGNRDIKSLADLNYFEELAEDQTSLEGNAWQKVRFVNDKFKMDAFADDTGLEVEALGGEPGVYSARYAGNSRSFDDNMDKVLQKLGKSNNRKAQFRTVIALIYQGVEYQFEGICKGEILRAKQGNQGFGYDPIFKPEGHEKSFAEMDLDEKNRISHRGLAVQKLLEFLNA